MEGRSRRQLFLTYLLMLHIFSQYAVEGVDRDAFQLILPYPGYEGSGVYEERATEALASAAGPLFGLDGSEVDVQQALRQLSPLATAGDAQAQSLLGFVYGVGLGPVERDDRLSAAYDTAAALGHDHRALATLGFQALQSHEFCRAAALYGPLATYLAESAFEDGFFVKTDAPWLADVGDSPDEAWLQRRQEVTEYREYAAEYGDAQAQYTLAVFSLLGEDPIPRDHDRAYHLFAQAAEQDFSMGYYGLAFMHEKGLVDGVHDVALARQFLEEGWALGDARCAARLAYLYLRDGQSARALDYAKQAVAGGDDLGHVVLGTMHALGVEVARSAVQAERLFAKAAAAGSLLGLHNLAVLRLNKSRGESDECEDAARLFRRIVEDRAAHLGLDHAFEAYATGQLDLAYVLYLELAHMGVQVAQANAAFLAEKAWKHELLLSVEVGEADVRWLYALAAQQDVAPALLWLGDDAYGADRWELAARLYQRAADEGSAQAAFNVGYMYHHGLGLPRDPHLAKRFYDESLVLLPAAYVPSRLAVLSLAFDYLAEHRVDGIPGLGVRWDSLLLAGLGWLICLVFSLRARLEIEDWVRMHWPRP